MTTPSASADDPPANPAVTAPLANGTLSSGIAGGGGLRWSLVDLSRILEAVRRRLDLSPVAAAALGRTLAGACLLFDRANRTPERLVLEVRGDGPLGAVVAEVTAGESAIGLRGTLENPRADVADRPDGKLAVGRGVGRGRLQVLVEGKQGQARSQVELVSGEIGDDLAHFLVQSEQTRSAVLVGVLAQPQGVAGAGGMLIEALPDATDSVLSRLESNLAAMAGVSQVLAQSGPEGLLAATVAGLEPVIQSTLGVHYRCRCSRERILHQLRALAHAAESELAGDDASLVVECGFCGERYAFAPAEVEPADAKAGTTVC